MKSGNPSEWETGPPRRILGMKIWQAVILGGMAVMDCFVLVVSAVVIIRSTPSSAGGSVASAAATAMPVAVTMEPTPVRSELMDGWVKFAVPEMEVWLPGSFAAGKPKTGADAIIASLKEKGAHFNWDVINEQLESVTENYVMWAVDSYQGDPDVITNIAFVYDVPNPGELLADYATRFVGAMSDSFVLIEQANVRHPDYDAELVILESKPASGTPARMAIYALRDRDLVWVIMCFTAADELDGRLPVFNQIVGTFRVLQAP
jgi:hypothetical protein